ncbi:MbnP family protein [Cerasicoccus fimbriatus]|uniref:MbnP family protein n=1 Tax=Cerasicoccus fimbriatus TaxID=3014554 RepID=UPI0022B4263B|nr:MbnP family protein [Cerasicoccus sp. TK19100]
MSIAHHYDGQRLQLDSLRYETRAGETFSLTRLSYLLSNFALQSESGEWVEIADSVAWVDLASRRESIWLENIPDGRYRALRFAVGVESARNHADPSAWPADHPLNPALNNLHWGWQGGYIFAAIEGRYREGESLSGFVYHLANDWNYRLVTLPLTFQAEDAVEIHLSLDLASWFHAPEPIAFAADGVSTHSREGDLVAAKLATNILSAFSVSRIVKHNPGAMVASVTPIDMPDHFEPYPFRLSGRFPRPALPPDNPLIVERVELGRRLFFDHRLSRSNRISCVNCHQPEEAFADRRVMSMGVDRQRTARHSMPLFNLAWKEHFFWDGRVTGLREQVLHPIIDPVEMGSDMDALLAELKADQYYRIAFKEAFGEGEISERNLGLALESFLLTLTSFDSRFDQAMRGEAELTTTEKRGFELFMTEFEPRSRQFGADCFHCHGGALFSDNQFHNNGLALLRGDTGRGKVTGKSADVGKFVTPSLRNVALTAPYMHDGRFATLEEVIEHYSSGVESSETLDPNLAKHPRGGLNLSTEDQAALVAFLKTLSDPQFQPKPHRHHQYDDRRDESHARLRQLVR